MAVVTFWSDGKEQTGKTLSLAAISTYMAIEHNIKILIISTSTCDPTLHNCFISNAKEKTSILGGISKRNVNAAMQNGMLGLTRMARSNKVTPTMVKDYTSIVFKDALEILYSYEEDKENTIISRYYPDIIEAANQYYDFVFVDLDTNIDPEIQGVILKQSDLIVANVTQRLSCINRYIKERKQSEILASRRTITLIGRYDKNSKYTAKNIARYMRTRDAILTIPYNTLLYDAAEEAGIPDYFLNFMKTANVDKENKDYVFFQEIKGITEEIQERLREVNLNM